MDEAVQTSGGNQAHVTFGELLHYLGLRLLMATTSGWTTDQFWDYTDASTPHNQEAGLCPYNFWAFMLMHRFKTIMQFLMFMDAATPTLFVDKFWEVHQMIKAWNANMADIFVAGWVICLDESMSIWHYHWTCPGWIWCPWKPHPYGNEFHTICCALLMIMFLIELVEGKDSPAAIPVEFKEKGRAAGLLLRML